MADNTSNSSDDPRPPRQVLPDVDEGAELAGYSVFGLIRLYLPAATVLFYAFNLAPPGWMGPLVTVGAILTAGTTVIVFAAPSGEPPGEYVRTLYDHYCTQGVTLHE